jgi:hypothetical protein
MAATELETITVRSNEIQPIIFGPETHGISKLVELNDGRRLFYVGPLEELERLTPINVVDK